MMRLWGSAAVCGAMMLSAICAEAAPPVEAFGNLPVLTKVHLSPDGKHFSAIESLNGRPTVVVFALDEPTKPIIFSDPESFAEDSTWVNNDRLICVVYGNIVENTKEGLEIHRWTRAISVSVSGKDPVVLTARMRVHRYNRNAGTVVALDTTDPDIAYMAIYNTNGAAEKFYSYDLVRVNVETGKVDIAMRGTEETQGWIMDGNGGVVARVDEKLDKPTDRPMDNLFIYRNGSPEQVASFDASKGWEVGYIGLTADGKALAVSRFGDHDTMGIDAFPLDGTSFGQTLIRDPAYDISMVRLDDWNARLVGADVTADKGESHYFDPKYQKLQHALEAALHGETVVIESTDKSGINSIVSSEDPQNPRTYWLYNSQTHQLKALAQQYPTLQPSDLGQMKAISYKASDGTEIHGYLTLPPGKSGTNLPMVVLPHGGPEARDEMRFDWLTQFFATRGYAVFQPNFRGSYGYGRKFVEASNGQWGLKMQSDITDGVKKLIADGTADPKRICIVGASYGGYAALAGATFTPDRSASRAYRACPTSSAPRPSTPARNPRPRTTGRPASATSGMTRRHCRRCRRPCMRAMCAFRCCSSTTIATSPYRSRKASSRRARCRRRARKSHSSRSTATTIISTSPPHASRR